MRILTKSDILTFYDFTQAIAAAKRAFIQYSSNETTCPVRINTASPSGANLFMPAATSTEIGCKVLTSRSNNKQFNLPAIQAIHAVIDEKTGQISTILDGSLLTIFRTGAMTGVAAEAFSLKNASNLLIIGSGVQGLAAAKAICCVRKIEQITVCGRSFGPGLDKFEAEFPGVKIVKIIDLKGFEIEKQQIIVTATTASEPLFDLKKVAPGTFISCVGGYQPHTRELDFMEIQARIVVDTRDGCFEEAGELIIPQGKGQLVLDENIVEIGEVLAGIKEGRQNDQEVVIFKTVGCAIQDCVVGAEIARIGAERGVGTVVEM